MQIVLGDIPFKIAIENEKDIVWWITWLFPIAVIAIGIWSNIQNKRSNQKSLNQLETQHIFTVGQLHLQHRENLEKDIDHYRRSSRPAIHVGVTTRNYLEEREFHITLSINNGGMGPAEITDIIYKYENKEYKNVDQILKANYPDTFNLLLNRKCTYSRENGFNIPVNEKNNLFVFVVKLEDDNIFANKIEEILKKVRLSFTTKSIYDEEWTKDVFIFSKNDTLQR